MSEKPDPARVEVRAVPELDVLVAKCPVCECQIYVYQPIQDDHGAWVAKDAERWQDCPDCDALVEFVPIAVKEAYPPHPPESEGRPRGRRNPKKEAQGMSHKLFPEPTREQKERRLTEILQSAEFHRSALEGLAASALSVTGEEKDNSFAEEAVFDGSLTAAELLKSVEAGHYVRD